jgi:O-antigen/teichoic acid export membrane protein
MTFEMIKNLLRNSFFVEIKILFTGTVIAQLITFATLPILTFLFTPAQFGVFALFFTIVNAIGFISAGRFDAALMLPKEEKNAALLFILGFVICIFVSIISAFIIIVLPIHFLPIIACVVSEFKIEIPCSIFLVGIYTLLSAYCNRAKKYKQMSFARVLQNTVVSAFSISFGFFALSAKGLVYGFMLGQLLSSLLLLRNNVSVLKLHKYNFNECIKIGKEYKSFPLFSVPMVFLNTLSINILIFLLTIFVGSSFVGLYSQAYKAVSYPFFILSSSLVPVFFQRIVVSDKKNIFALRTFLMSIAIGIIILIPIFFWGETLFSLVFGEKWRLSGQIAAFLIPLSIASFAVNNISSLFAAINKNHILLIWQILYVTLAVSLVYMVRHCNTMHIISLYSWFGMTMYLGLAAILFFILKD